MKIFRIFLAIQCATIVGYTVVVGTVHGWDLFPIFVGDLLALNWRGQFNLDFLWMLTLAATWICWRNRFSSLSVLLGLTCLVGGVSFLAPYLLFLSFKEKGDMRRILIGIK